MKSEDKKRPSTRQQKTTSIYPGAEDAGMRSPVVKADSGSAVQVQTGGGRASNMVMPQSSPQAPEEILVDVHTCGDGMAFRFTWS